MSAFNDERNRITRNAIKRKLELLRGYIDNPPSSSTYVPRSVRQFRDWTDISLGVVKIGSPGTLNRKQSPHNRDLIDELDSVLRELALARSRPRQRLPPLEMQLKVVQESLRLQRTLNERLVSQVHEIRHALEMAELKVQAAVVARTRAEETIVELRRLCTHDNASVIRIVSS